MRNNDLEKMHLLEAADEWPFLREVVGKGGGGEAEEEEEEEEGKQEHLLCDAIMGEPFYYRVRRCCLLYPCLPSSSLCGGLCRAVVSADNLHAPNQQHLGSRRPQKQAQRRQPLEIYWWYISM